MRNLLLLGVAGLLGATLTAPATVNAPVLASGEMSAAWARDPAVPGTTDFLAAVTADLAASVSVEAARPTCFGRRATLVGTSGDDVLVGTPHKDVIVARAGHDVVRSRGGVDFVCGGGGDDRLLGGPNPNDWGFTQTPPRGDRLSGGKGDDRIVDGGGGNADLLLGGPGNDRLLTANGGYAEGRTLKGGPGADRLTTHPGSYETGLLGGPGPDTLISNGHNQFLAGGAGTDVLDLAGSGDTVVGVTADGDHVHNRGAAQIVLLFGPEPVEVDLAAGTARRIGAAAGDVLTGLSPPKRQPWIVVYGTDGDDRISGRDAAGDQMYGRTGDDILAGRGGGDILGGDPGNDVLDGGDGDDYADGGRGRDTCLNAEQVTGCSP